MEAGFASVARSPNAPIAGNIESGISDVADQTNKGAIIY